MNNPEKKRLPIGTILISTPLLLWVAIGGCKFVIPTGAMEDTVLIGDSVIVNFAAYGIPAAEPVIFGRSPQRGDIVTFHYPVDRSQMFVSRIAGIPGDRIVIVDKRLQINGKAADEPYVVHKTEYLDAYRDNLPSPPNTQVYDGALKMLRENVDGGEVLVPENSYFVLGDSRDLSLDSRYWGFVPRGNIVGKVWVIYWSYDAPTEHLQDDPGISIDHIRDLTLNWFSKTRWRRLFRSVHQR